MTLARLAGVADRARCSGTSLAPRVVSRRARMLAAAMALAVPFAAAAPSAHARLLSPARGHDSSLEGVARVQKLVLDRAALAVARAADLVLARFEPFAPGARAEIMEPGGARALTLPDQVYFRGTVAGEDDSHVLLIVARARVHGFVVSRGEE